MSSDGRLLPQSFVGDGVTGNAYESDCFLAMGDDGKSGVFSSDELTVVKNGELLGNSIPVLSSIKMRTLAEVRVKEWDSQSYLQINMWV